MVNKYQLPDIDFVWIREHGEEFYENDDSPVDGGLGRQGALDVAGELLEAVKYMENLP